MEEFKALPFYIKNDVEVPLFDPEFSSKSPEDIVDDILGDYKQYEAKKVIFKLKELQDFDTFFNIKKEIMHRHATEKTLPDFVLDELSSKGNMNGHFWPSNWTTSAEFKTFDESSVKMFDFLHKVSALPNLESLSILGVYCQKELPCYLGRFPKLKKFKLYNTRISQLPQAMRFCRDIEELEIQNNAFQFLPFWITKLKNLKTLSRHSNLLEGNTSQAPVIQQESCEKVTNEEGKGNQNSPKSLILLSATATISAFPYILTEDDLENKIPRDLLHDLRFFSSTMRFCDNCSKAFADDEYISVQKTVSSFKGYTCIPFKAIVCSVSCAEAVTDEFQLIDSCGKEDKEEKYCFDISDSIPFKCKCKGCRVKRLKKKFLCCFS